jgi:hypothetical protein
MKKNREKEGNCLTGERGSAHTQVVTVKRGKDGKASAALHNGKALFYSLKHEHCDEEKNL